MSSRSYSYTHYNSDKDLPAPSFVHQPGSETDNAKPKILALSFDDYGYGSSWSQTWADLDKFQQKLWKQKQADTVGSLSQTDFVFDGSDKTRHDYEDLDDQSEMEELVGRKSSRPIWKLITIYQNQLAVDVNVDQILQSNLRAMAQQLKDYRQDLNTEDYRPVHQSRYNAMVYGARQPKIASEPQMELVRKHARVSDLIDPSLNAFEFNTSEGTDQHWIPSDVFINTEGQAEFRSEINNLDTSAYPQFQGLCAKVMTAMVPYFEIITRQQLRNRSVQVIVKAQVYEVMPGGLYQGSFHREGTDYEKIKAVGIYYVDIDSRLKGGNLELLRLSRSGSNASSDYTPIQVQAKQCVVFANDHVYHRMTSLTYPQSSSATEDLARRWILNFFLVDPKKKIRSSAVIPVNQRFHPDRPGPQCVCCGQIASSYVYDPIRANQKRKELRESRTAYSEKRDPRLGEYYGGQD